MIDRPEIPRLTGEQLLPLMVASERRSRQRRADHTAPSVPLPPCAVCQEPVQEQDITLGLGDVDDRELTNRPCGHRMTYNLKVAGQLVGRVQRIVDQEGGGTLSEATGLDKTRRYLRPVRATIISDDPAGVHLAVYSWLPLFEAWVTGAGICGQSMQQGALPEGTAVTCRRCEEWRPEYERMLAPGYRPEDDDPAALRKEIGRLKAEVAAARKYAGEMREFCSPHGVSVYYADQLEAAMDRAREAGR